MADNLSKEQRRKNMQAIKSISKLESIVSKELWKKGFRFRRNSKNLFGKPDIAIKKYKVAIFIDSCFWHQCPLHANMPKSNKDYWEKKLIRNCERDKEVNEYYQKKGWNIKRVWEHDVKNDLEKVVHDLAELIIDAKEQKKRDPVDLFSVHLVVLNFEVLEISRTAPMPTCESSGKRLCMSWIDSISSRLYRIPRCGSLGGGVLCLIWGYGAMLSFLFYTSNVTTLKQKGLPYYL